MANRSVTRAATSGGATTVWASWNGATEVAGWRVLAGPSPGALQPVADAPRSGFETTIALPSPQQYVAPAAVTPQVWIPPALTAAKLTPPATSPGVNRLVVVPSPSWPEAL